ncbi:MAG: 4-alpha-glucanotransferase, partial [Propionicimonas sp.]
MPLSNPFLYELASAFGIATEFWDWKGRRTEIEDDTVVAILAGMDVDASDPDKAAAALQAWRDRPWTRVLPPCTVLEQGRGKRVLVHVPDGAWVRVAVRLEEGGYLDIAQVDHVVEPRS